MKIKTISVLLVMGWFFYFIGDQSGFYGQPGIVTFQHKADCINARTEFLKSRAYAHNIWWLSACYESMK